MSGKTLPGAIKPISKNTEHRKVVRSMERVQPREIRIILDGGIVQNVALGKDVPKDLTITLADLDVEGQTSEDDSKIEQNGYGEWAYCSTFHKPDDTIDKDQIDKDGTAWL